MPTMELAGLPVINFGEPELELTPSELEAASGLTTEMQRVWRSRGQLQKEKRSHARYSLRETAVLLLAYEVTRWGIAPTEAIKIGKRYGPSIIQLALFNVEGTCEIHGERVHVETLRNMLTEDSAEYIFRILAQNEIDSPPRCLISSDRSVPQAEFEYPHQDEDSSVSLQIINLVNAGIQLAVRIGRPLVKVEIGQRESWSKDAVRRLAGGTGLEKRN
ncbi:MAG: hypothetical protein KF849_13910 [Rhizobiaceae bacterium]|nr:hypothetical protein [Rhizobiaceae bacterium]